MRDIDIVGYEAYTNSNLTDGSGVDVTIGYFTYLDDARLATKSRV